MYKLKLNTELGNFEGVDTVETLLPILDVIDEDNPYEEVQLIIETTEPANLDYLYPQTALLLFNISQSIALENDFSPLVLEVSLQNSENLIVLNDKKAYEGYSTVGIIFSSDPDLIINYENSDILKRKFILVPYKLSAGNQYFLNLKIYRNTNETQNSVIRNKFYRYEKIVYDFSKSFVGSLELLNNTSLSDFYATYGREQNFALIKKEALLNKIFYPEDFLNIHLATNTTRILDDGSLDSFLLNYEKNLISNYRIESNTVSKFPYLKFTYSNSILVGTYENITLDTEYYFKQVSYLVFSEILKPYIINSGFLPIHTTQNISKLSNFLREILQRLATLSSVRKYITNYTTFGGNLLEGERQKLWFSIFYLESLFFVDFVNGLLQKGYISTLPSEVNTLTSTLNSLFSNFIEHSYFLNNHSIIEENSLETDFILSLFFISLIYHLSGKSIFPSGLSLLKYLEVFYGYYLKLSESLFFSRINLDPNTFTEIPSVDIKKVSIKALLLSLYSSLLKRQEFFIDLNSRLSIYGINDILIEENTNSYTINLSLSSLTSSPRQKSIYPNTVILYPGTGPDESFVGKNIILSNSALNDYYLFLPNEIFKVEIKNNKLVVDVNKKYYLLENNKLIPKFYTLDLHANLITLYTKIKAIVLNNDFFISSGGSSQIEIIINTFVYEYLKFLMSGNLNNKVSQNTTNFKIILTNTF